MAKETAIEWADSTLNMMMGCDGCELSSRLGSGTCYAETLTDRYAGSSTGYPASFYEPKLFTARLEQALRWKDLAGTERPDKPWLSGRPRHIFNGDMGDYWTESLPLDWLAHYVPKMAASPHVWMFLTKRPARMRKFWRAYGPVPPNFILMTSVTGPETAGRISELERIPDCVRGLSCEPLLGPVDLTNLRVGGDRSLYRANALTGDGFDGKRISWVVCGGESGPGARPMDVAWMRSLREQCGKTGAAYFAKQLGARPLDAEAFRWRHHAIEQGEQRLYGPNGGHAATLWRNTSGRVTWFTWDLKGIGGENGVDDDIPTAKSEAVKAVMRAGHFPLPLKSRKGGDPAEWPEDLRVREMPEAPRG